MNDVYFTQCSLIRTYHQMENARNAIALSETPRLVDWFKKILARLHT